MGKTKEFSMQLKELKNDDIDYFELMSDQEWQEWEEKLEEIKQFKII